jgi:hypothetical protein
VDPREYWDYTLNELTDCIQVYKKRQEMEQDKMLIQMYTSASLTANFVNKALSGKKVPTLGEVFPKFNSIQQELDVVAYENQFMQYAETFNKNRSR